MQGIGTAFPGGNVKISLKKFIVLTGLAVVGFLVCVILHNLFYAIGESYKHISFLHNMMEVLHAAFFIIAVIICPVVFLIGIIGAIYMVRSQLIWNDFS